MGLFLRGLSSLQSKSGFVLFGAGLMIPTYSFAAGGAHSLSQLFNSNTALDRLQEAYSAVQSDSTVSDLLKSDSGSNSLLLSKRIADNEMETTRFQHYYKDVEVVGSVSLYSIGSGGSAVSNSLAQFDLNSNPTLSASDAVSIARSLVGDKNLESLPRLRILPSEDDTSQARLTYWVKLSASPLEPTDEVIVDAHSGEVLASYTDVKELAHVQVYSAKDRGLAILPHFKQNENQPDAPPVLVGCEATDLATQVSHSYSAKDCEKAAENQCQIVLMSDDGSGTPLPSAFDLDRCDHAVIDSSVGAGADAVVQRAAANALQVLTYYKEHHNRNSYDDKGADVVNIVHAGVKFDNAYWFKDKMVYGEGDGVVMGDLTAALDVAGHEMTHGVVSQTADLASIGESGALNESYADIFGKLIEGKDDWVMGRGLFLGANAKEGIRNLAQPEKLTTKARDAKGNVKVVHYPAHMKDKMKSPSTCDGSNDRCWVHLNSTIPSHAAYLVTQAIGNSKAEKIYYHALTQLLSERTNFKGAAAATLKTCDLLGYGSSTCDQVKEAFAKVGL